jgi:hypothetical protein
MRWWLNMYGVNTGATFDDGIPYATPGDEGFTRDHVNAELTRRGDGWSADFMDASAPALDAPADSSPAG